MDSILVTGGSGFTGGALCRRLVADGESVVTFVRASSRTEDLRALGVECRVVDIGDAADVRANFHGIRAVYHIAGAFRGEHADLDEFRRINVEATRNLLEAARDAGVERFVHCSTVGVQGHIEDPPADENYRFKPHDHYQRSKLEGELVARKYMAAGLPGAVIRPSAIYGPGDLRFLKLMRTIARGQFVMIGAGRNLYHMTYIDDLVNGFLLAGRRPEALGEVFSIAGGKYLPTRELVNLIADLLERPRPRLTVPSAPLRVAAVACSAVCRPLKIEPPLYPRRLDFFTKGRAFSTAKARRLLGYEPAVSLEDGLRRTIGWYRTQGLM
ncbi:MAG: NAD-dependent epimerase/dehydratase family protein [Aquisalimonadaceae bacterium]